MRIEPPDTSSTWRANSLIANPTGRSPLELVPIVSVTTPSGAVAATIGTARSPLAATATITAPLIRLISASFVECDH